MADNFYDRMTVLWKRIRSSKSGTVKLKDVDRETIIEAFNKAWYHEELIETSEELREFQNRWEQANKLFHEKNKDKFDYDTALREAVMILGIDEQATKRGKRKRLHPSKNEELRKRYQIKVMFDILDEDGNLIDNFKGDNTQKIKQKHKKEDAINALYKEFGFSTPKRLSRYLREDLGFKNVPSMTVHSKKTK